MRYSMLVPYLMFVFAACAGGDSIVSVPTPSGRVYVLTIPSPHVGVSGTQLMYGSQKIDYSSWDLGMSTVVTNETWGVNAHNIFLKEGETVALAITVNGASGIESDGVKAPAYHLTSDWAAINPLKSPGVLYDGVSEFSLIVRKYDPREQNGTVRDDLIFGRSSVVNAHVDLTFPVDKLVRFVTPRQIRRVGCAGNGTLVLRSEKGFGESIEDRYLQSDMYYAPVQETTITCTEYENVATARAALAAQTLSPKW